MEGVREKTIIDLSISIDNSCLTCGAPWHQKVLIERMGELETVGRNTSRFVLGSHSATHMDAPCHFIANGHGIDENKLDLCIGTVTCVDFRHFGPGDVIRLDDVKNMIITERMLFVFGWCKFWKTNEYYRRFPYFTTEAVSYLVDSGMKLMAMDTPSPDDGEAIAKKDDSPNHKRLLGSDVIIIEYLYNTEQINFQTEYELIALPLKIAGADGAPARVVLREK